MRPMATFLEACHDGPAELGAWLDGLASTLPRAVDARLGVNLGCFLRSDGSRAITGRGATWELAARYVGDSNPNPFAVRLTADGEHASLAGAPQVGRVEPRRARQPSGRGVQHRLGTVMLRAARTVLGSGREHRAVAIDPPRAGCAGPDATGLEGARREIALLQSRRP